MMRFFPTLLLAILFTATICQTAAGQEGPPAELRSFTIGILTDGPLHGDPTLVSLFKKEIQNMAEGEFAISFPQSLRIEADSTAKGVSRGLSTLLADPDCDLILALGLIASTKALALVSPGKPVVAPFIFDAGLQKAPRKGLASGVHNLYYINLNTPIDQEVITFRKIIPFTNLTLILDQRDLDGVPAAQRLANYLAFEHSIKVFAVPMATSAAEAVAQLPEETEAVLVGPIWQAREEEIEKLASLLKEKKIPSMAMANFDYLEAGFFASTMPADSIDQLARQVAISIQEIILGEDPGNLPVAFSKRQKIAFNMATARAIEVYPSLTMRTGATLLHEQNMDIERRVNLPQVVAEALAANLDLAAAEREVTAGEYSVAEARAALLPQIGIHTDALAIDDDRAAFAQGANPERVFKGGIAAAQQIYSEAGWAGYQIEKFAQSGRGYDRDRVRLDIIFEAALTYLNVLRQKTIEQIQKENLRLTQANLDRAQIRLTSGIAGPDELYRWQTKFANDQRIVLRSESESLSSMQALNRILNRPLLEDFIAEEVDLNDPLLLIGNRLYLELIKNPVYFKKFANFTVAKGLLESPELKAFEMAIAAQNRLIVKAGRQYWLPTFTLEATADQLFADGGAGQRNETLTGLDDTEWLVGMFARLPLFEGGRKNATLNRSKEVLRQLHTEQLAASERISQRILLAVNDTRASYPSIRLSKDAVYAARQNMELVTESYVQGTKSIIDLLDAQNQALNAELDAANAIYNFLADFMALQRSMGVFVTFLPEEDKKIWADELREYMEEDGY